MVGKVKLIEELAELLESMEFQLPKFNDVVDIVNPEMQWLGGGQ